jgi:hypothetical protein
MAATVKSDPLNAEVISRLRSCFNTSPKRKRGPSSLTLRASMNRSETASKPIGG